MRTAQPGRSNWAVESRRPSNLCPTKWKVILESLWWLCWLLFFLSWRRTSLFLCKAHPSSSWVPFHPLPWDLALSFCLLSSRIFNHVLLTPSSQARKYARYLSLKDNKTFFWISCSFLTPTPLLSAKLLGRVVCNLCFHFLPSAAPWALWTSLTSYLSIPPKRFWKRSPETARSFISLKK